MSGWLLVVFMSELSWASAPDARTPALASRDAGAEPGSRPGEISVAGGRTTTVQIEPRVGQPLERAQELQSKVPSLRRALALDGDQRWAEAVGLYQQALIEIGAAVRFSTTSIWEAAAFKVDIERRRSRALAQARLPAWNDEPTPPVPRTGSPPQPIPALERARLLRAKLMVVRSGLGSVPPALVSATLVALDQALRESPSSGTKKPDRVPGSRPTGGDPEVRLLLCATRAAAGDRMGARLELAHVTQWDRSDPARALALATCQAALGWNDDAVVSLAVAIDRQGPSSRFLPEQTRELQGSNDWDPLRGDPRFDRLFR